METSSETDTSWRGLADIARCELLDGKLHINGQVWQLERELNKCAYGNVWLAVQVVEVKNRRGMWSNVGSPPVAVKQLVKDQIVAHEGNLYEDTVGEVNILRQLQMKGPSEFIVDFISIGQDALNLFLMLEFISSNPKKPVHLELLDHVQGQPNGRLTEPKKQNAGQ